MSIRHFLSVMSRVYQKAKRLQQGFDMGVPKQVDTQRRVMLHVIPCFLPFSLCIQQGQGTCLWVRKTSLSFIKVHPLLFTLQLLPTTHLVNLCFFKYLVAQLPQGRCPSHLVLRARQRSQLAHKATALPVRGKAAAAAPKLLLLFMWRYGTTQNDSMRQGLQSHDALFRRSL